MTDETQEIESPSIDAESDAVAESPSVDTGEESTELEASETDESPSEVEDARASDEESEEYRNLLAKYKGDKGAAAKHYWELTKQNKELAQRAEKAEALEREIEELKAKREGRKPPAEPEAIHPDLQALEQSVQSLSQEITSIATRQQAVVKDYWEQDAEVRALDRLIAKADELDRPDYEREKKARLQAQRLAEIENFSLKKELDRLGVDKRRMEYQYQQAQTWFAGERERQQEAQEEAKQAEADFNAHIDRSVSDIAKAHSIPDVLMDDLNETVNAKLIAFSLKQGRKEVPFRAYEEVIKQAVERYAKSRDLASRQRLQAVSKAKLASTGSANPPRKPDAPPPATKATTMEEFLAPITKRMRNLAHR